MALKYALRTLWRDRGFSVMAVVSLAIGIGANTAIFSLVSGILLRPLAYSDPERLFAVSLSTPLFRNGDPLPVNLGHLVEWRKRTQSFEAIGAHRNTTSSLTGDGRPELIPGAQVSANFFAVLGVRPRLGRFFLEQEDQFGQHQVVVLADSLWQRRFAADPSIIGKKIVLGGSPFTVVGVLPPDFVFPKPPEDYGKRLSGRMELFRPLGYRPEQVVPQDGNLNYGLIARVRPGTTGEVALSEIRAAQSAMDAQKGGESFQLSPIIAPLQQRLTGDVRQSLIVLMSAVGAVLLVLCVNLANLSLSRAAGRAREAAIRVALGANRWQLARESLTETGLISALGGALGVLFAFIGLQRLLAVAPVDLPRLRDVSIDARVLAFALGISVLTALLFGILPILRGAANAAPYETLKSTSYANAGGPSGLRLRNLLVALEVGLSASLLVTAGLFLSSFVRLTTIPKGFEVERVLAVDVALPGTKYSKDADITRFFNAVLDQARVLPGVESAAVSSYLPLQGESWIDTIKVENDSRPESQLPHANLRFISPGYFRTLRIPVRAGRDFEPADSNRLVAIVSESLARKLWSGADPIGRKLIDVRRAHEVVGVVADARTTSLDRTPVDMLYIPLWQRPQNSSSILVRTAMDPKSIAAALRSVVWSSDGDVPVPEERTLGQLMSESLARRRFQMALVVLFAAAALALAAFGTYGVVSYAVARRRAEIGIRMALGAGRGNVLGLVLRQGMMPVFCGLAAGALAALAIGRYVSSLLFQVSPRDPAAFAIAAAMLIAVSTLACWIPARRAARLDPLDAIRRD
jgi:putative ABC transport system permease protein